MNPTIASSFNISFEAAAFEALIGVKTLQLFKNGADGYGES